MYFSNEIDVTGGAASDLGYTILFFGAEYLLMQQKLAVNAAVSPTVGDITRTLINGGARYNFTRTLSLEGKLGIYLNAGDDSDVIWSFVLRADV